MADGRDGEIDIFPETAGLCAPGESIEITHTIIRHKPSTVIQCGPDYSEPIIPPRPIAAPIRHPVANAVVQRPREPVRRPLSHHVVHRHKRQNGGLADFLSSIFSPHQSR
jgi:hypothetical protein